LRDTIRRKSDFLPRPEGDDTEAADTMLAEALRSVFGDGALAVALLQLEGASEKSRDGWLQIIQLLRNPLAAELAAERRDAGTAGE
jgi:hypothetical protein